MFLPEELQALRAAAVRAAVWISVIIGCALGALAVAAWAWWPRAATAAEQNHPAAAAPFYLDLSAGATDWPDTSNGDEVEADANAKPAAALALGAGLAPWLDLELEAAARFPRTHGQNANGGRQGGNDRQGYVLTGMLNAWAGPRWGRVRVYAGGGAGLGAARFLGRWDLAPAWQAGGGLVVHVTPHLAWHIGYRYLRLAPTRHNGGRRPGAKLEARYDSHTVLTGPRVRW